MRRSMLLMFVLLISAPLWAEVTKTATWVIPTERVNGDALPLAEISRHELVCQRTSGEVVLTVTEIPAASTTLQTDPVFDAGEFICRMRTADTEGRISEWGDSNVFIVGRCDVSDCRPTPPQSITIVLP